MIAPFSTAPLTTAIRAAALGASVLAGCLALSACSPSGLKGDRGLPPPPENLDYPNLATTPPDARRPLKSKAEQDRLQAELLARKPQRR